VGVAGNEKRVAEPRRIELNLDLTKKVEHVVLELSPNLKEIVFQHRYLNQFDVDCSKYPQFLKRLCALAVRYSHVLKFPASDNLKHVLLTGTFGNVAAEDFWRYMAALNGLRTVTFFAWRTDLLVKLIEACPTLNTIVLMNPSSFGCSTTLSSGSRFLSWKTISGTPKAMSLLLGGR